MTNADRIRAMTDEELAEMFAVEVCDCRICEPITKSPCKRLTTYAECIKHWLEWLKMEGEE